MKTTESNKLIAEFMGAKFNQKQNRYENIPLPNSNSFGILPAEVLGYHSSWNWLIPVISKIEQLPNAWETEEFLLIRDELCMGVIENTYKYVLDFIKQNQ